MKVNFVNPPKPVGHREDFDEVWSQVSQAKASRSEWEDDIAYFRNLRNGVPEVKNKDWPYPGAPNLFLNIVDTKVKAKRAQMMDLLRPHPIATFREIGPDDTKKARLNEIVFDHLCTVKMPGFYKNARMLLDYALQDGFSVAKVTHTWQTQNIRKEYNVSDFPVELFDALSMGDEVAAFQVFFDTVGVEKDERNIAKLQKQFEKLKEGKYPIIIKYEETTYRGPLLTARQCIDIDVPENTRNLEDAEWVSERYYLSWRELVDAQNKGLFKNIDAVKESSGSLTSKFEEIFSDEDDRTGVYRTNFKDCYELCDVYYFRNFGDRYERWLVTINPASNTILRDDPCPYDHWPFYQIYTDERGEGYYDHHGIPRLLRDLQKEKNSLHNERLIHYRYTNVPLFKCDRSAPVRKIRLVPGEIIREPSLEQLYTPTVNQASEREEMYLDQMADRVTASNEMLGGREADPMMAKTATHVNTMLMQQQVGLHYEMMVFAEQLGKVFSAIWTLQMEYGDESEFVRIAGDDWQKISKYDLAGKYDIVPSTDAESANRVLQMQKAQMLYELLINQPYPWIDKKALTENLIGFVDPKSLKKIVLPEGTSLVNQMKKQILENIIMKNGYDVPIEPDDADEMHYQVVNGELSDPQKAAMVDEISKMRMMQHAQLHVERIQKMQGGKNGNAGVLPQNDGQTGGIGGRVLQGLRSASGSGLGQRSGQALEG